MNEPGEPQLVQVLRTAMKTAAEQGVSLREQSRRSGVNFSIVSRFVRGERDVTATTAGRLAETLGLALVSMKAAGTKRSGKPAKEKAK